ncbi:hypothetical protein JXB31_05510 [Candidatus Woesearchaeota archaeon]|nr:hypothetical protein [Candidatus Woesearchaeota archaeon]
MPEQKIILTNAEPELNPCSDDLAKVIIERIGLMPRKKGSTDQMNRVMVEMYERAKEASRVHQPAKAIITVEGMGSFAGITRQTMYDYLRRWLELDIIIKTSFIDMENKVVIGYKLNGNTLEQAFEKARTRISNNLDLTLKYIRELQRTLKNEKISTAAQKNRPATEADD